MAGDLDARRSRQGSQIPAQDVGKSCIATGLKEDILSLQWRLSRYGRGLRGHYLQSSLPQPDKARDRFDASLYYAT